MGIQLIFCVEADSSCKSDFMYIKKAIYNFYDVDQANARITSVYMGGRGNYTSPKVKRDISKWIKNYAAGNKKGLSKVIYCFDCDNYDSKPEDNSFLTRAEKYCRDNGYEYVWFFRDVEHVFLGKQIDASLKKEKAVSFARNSLIKDVNIQNLKCSTYKNKRSNLCVVLDKYL